MVGDWRPVDTCVSWCLLHADALTGLASLRAGSIHCCVTSPPYYGLRDYAGVNPIRWPDGSSGKLGLEPTLELYIEHLVEIFREVRRVLRPDGTLWLNLGDSYAGTGKSGGGEQGDAWKTKGVSVSGLRGGKWQPPPTRYKSGDLLSMPHRVAHALQSDGWCLRSTIVWAKLSPMPENIRGWRWERCRTLIEHTPRRPKDSTQTAIQYDRENRGGIVNSPRATWADCTGCLACELNDGYVLRRGRWRPTAAHEYIFLLSPSKIAYFGDGEAMREDDIGTDDPRHTLHRPEPSGKIMPPHAGIRKTDERNGFGRNPRNVWTIGPEPYSGAHYASFPTEIPRRCIKAATSPAVCSECGAPHAPVVEPGSPSPGTRERTRLMGYRSTCGCKAGSCKAIVLDPFSGTGTTGAVAVQLGRSFVGIDLSLQYLVQDARQRIGATDAAAILRRQPRMTTIEGPLFRGSQETHE